MCGHIPLNRDPRAFNQQVDDPGRYTSMQMQYELVYIVPATFTDEDVGKIEGNIKALLEKYGAAITETQRLGKFRFAYPIKKVRHGHYILVNLTAEPSAVAKIEEALRISKEVLRYLLLKIEEVGESKFDLVQFQEVDVDAAKEEHPRRQSEKEPSKDKTKAAEEIKSGVAAIEATEEEGAEGKTEVAPALSDEELDKKLDEVLKSETVQVASEDVTSKVEQPREPTPESKEEKDSE